MTLRAAGRTGEQRHFSERLVRDGYWVDVYLSMVPYTQSDRQVFLDFLDAIRIEPKGLSSCPKGRKIRREESQKNPEVVDWGINSSDIGSMYCI